MVHHSIGGKTKEMASLLTDILSNEDQLIEFRSFSAFEAKASDILQSDGIIFGTPANFGYMSGALKDFFDRNYYELEGKVEAVPYAIFVSASTDGTGAVESVRKICRGLNLKEVQEPLVLTKKLSESDQSRLRNFGMTMAVGIDAGIF
tara:strand:+ start:828 stop:1271 length:444 start_codon:yes stop_codon:yes gene_type:complete